MKNNYIFDIEPFSKKDTNTIPLSEVIDEMVNFFSNDKCNRPILSNFEGKYVTICGYYKRFGYSHPNSMAVQNCFIQIDGESYTLGHMWWQNIYNNIFLNSSLTKGCFVTGTGIVKSYNCNDINFPCEKTYGITNISVK